MATPTPPSADEVRALVTRLVRELGEGGPRPAGGSEPAGATATAEGGTERRTGPVSTLALGADHGGYTLKERVAADLRDRGYTVHDCGTRTSDPVDYPDIAHEVAVMVARGDCEAGIVIDGAGIGSAIAANKVPGVRAATCWDVSSARNSREHNHANVLSLGAGLLGENLAREIIAAWLSTTWGTGRHERRVAKIGALEARYGTRFP